MSISIPMHHVVRPLARLRAVHPVWWLVAVIAATGAGLYVAVVADHPDTGEVLLPWWALALAILVTERWPVNLEFRRSAHSFSLTDVPIALGLVLATGPATVTGALLGAAGALWLRRLPPVKFAFNLAQFALIVCLAFVVVELIAGRDASFGPLLWVAVYLATQLGGLLTICLLCAAIWLTERALTREQVRQMFGMDAIVTAANTSFALAFAVILVAEPAATPILLVPLVLAAWGYRRYVSERQRHEQLEFLYEANRTLAAEPEIAAALQGLLERALDAFRAERAEILLLGAPGSPALRTALRADAHEDAMAPVDAGIAHALLAVMGDDGTPIALTEPFGAEVAPYLAERGIHDGMVAAVRGEDRTIGVLLLANRLGVTRGFTADDVALFETLAANASAALQFDRLEQAVTDLRELQDRLHHQAYHDPLTGLANRALFRQSVAGALEDAAKQAAVLFIDLDDFKAVNDTLGHAVGDDLLMAVADRLRTCVRDDDLIARLGGDEFAVLLCRQADAAQAGTEIAERILRAFELPVTAGERLLAVNMSIGVASSAHSGGVAADLLRDADVAMYEAKEAGKRGYATFDPAMRDALVRRHTLKEDLARAVGDGQLHVVFQPVVDLDSGAVVAAEALVRWQHPRHGTIAPPEFIPIAEETGLIRAIGRIVLEQACRQAAAWTTSGPDGAPVVVQVNLSAVELEDPGVVDAVRAAVRAAGIAPGQLVLEITETLLMRDAELGARTLEALRALGVRIALDDFGTGWSSLSYLRVLPIDQLKIAREFVDGIDADGENEAFVRMMVALATTMGLDVVAEGIENAAQLDVVRRLGCGLGQGFHLARPFDPREHSLDAARPPRAERP